MDDKLALQEIARLRRGVSDYLNGNYPSPRDHRPGKCKHGVNYWESCEQCIDDHFMRLLGEEVAP